MAERGRGSRRVVGRHLLLPWAAPSRAAESLRRSALSHTSAPTRREVPAGVMSRRWLSTRGVSGFARRGGARRRAGGRAGGRAPRAAAAASRRLARQRRAASSRAGKRRAHTEAAKTHTEAAKNHTEAAKMHTEAAKMHTEAALRKFAKKNIRVTLWISGDTGYTQLGSGRRL